MRYLKDCSNGRNNNLNIIRFVAAILVIFSHSFPLTGVDEPIEKILMGQIGGGGLAVSVFFFLGGFLICKSMHRLDNGKDYFKARSIRIFPPLCLVTVVITLVLGPIMTEYSVLEYFSSVQTYKYLLNCVFVLVHDLPGVFSNNIYNSTVNGVLWTLPVEFMCYIGCFVAYKIGVLDRSKLKVLCLPVFVIYSILCIVINNEFITGGILRPCIMFFAGMVCYVFRDIILMDKRILFVDIILLIISMVCGFFNVGIYVLWGYCLLYLAFGTGIKLDKFSSKHEISYGIYLTGWPIQQVICSVTDNGVKWYANFIIAAVAAIIIGYIISLFENMYLKKVK